MNRGVDCRLWSAPSINLFQVSLQFMMGLMMHVL